MTLKKLSHLRSLSPRIGGILTIERTNRLVASKLAHNRGWSGLFVRKFLFDSEGVMNHPDSISTLTIVPCPGCNAGLPEDSRFCRWCGTQLGVDSDPTEQLNFDAIPAPRDYKTARLNPSNIYHPVSGPLVTALVAGVPKRAPYATGRGLTKRMLLALMAVPIWVMIILLSPIDAYASAKIIGQRI